MTAANTLEYWPLGRITAYGKNPRKNADAVAVVARSLKEFGPRNPILVDPQGVVIAGHTRLLAAKSLGLKEFPVVVCHGLTPAQVRAYRIADNKTAEKADWDMDLLSDEVRMLADEDFDMESIGFDEAELAAMIGYDATEIEPPALASGDRQPFQQMTFTLHDDQAETVNRAVKAAIGEGPFADTGNENGNGNALARIAEAYIGQG